MMMAYRCFINNTLSLFISTKVHKYESVVIYSLCIVVLAQECCWPKHQGSSHFRELDYWERFVPFLL